MPVRLSMTMTDHVAAADDGIATIQERSGKDCTLDRMLHRYSSEVDRVEYCISASRGGLKLPPNFDPVTKPGFMADPKNSHFEKAVRDSFAAQQLMSMMGARLADVTPGAVEIRLPFRQDLTQQHGFLHAGVVSSALDSACGYAALSLLPEGADVLSVEFKINLLAPAQGEELIARGRVIRSGRTITVCEGQASMSVGGTETPIATMLATMMAVRVRGA